MIEGDYPNNPTITWTTFRVVVVRDITPAECKWLKATLVAGTVLNLDDDRYNCCSPSGIPVNDGGAMFEVPADAIVGIIEK